MSVQLRPLGDRVLIRPDQPPQQTASGLHLAEHWKPEQTGTVIAVGTPRHPRADDVEGVLQGLSFYIDQGVPGAGAMVDAANLLRDLVAVEPTVKVGDYVVFSWASGQDLWIDDTAGRCLVLREKDLLAVVGEGVTVETCEPNREVLV